MLNGDCRMREDRDLILLLRSIIRPLGRWCHVDLSLLRRCSLNSCSGVFKMNKAQESIPLVKHIFYGRLNHDDFIFKQIFLAIRVYDLNRPYRPYIAFRTLQSHYSFTRLFITNIY